MKITQYRTYFIDEVAPFFDKDEAAIFFYLIIEKWKNLRRVDLVLNPDLFFDESEIKKLDAIILELKQHKPIQYIIGSTTFFELEFLVNQHTLIPRPETEEIVEWTIKETNEKKHFSNNKIKILDIGTGSGCIAIALAKNIFNAEVHAIDVSKEALAVAQKNAENNNVNVQFSNQNILNFNELNQNYDIIVSNPPYIRMLEKAEINPNVLKHEPHLALFVENEDPLLFYRKIAQIALKNLNKNGLLFFEINQYLADQTIELLKNLNFENILLKKDIFGNNRMIKCQKPA